MKTDYFDKAAQQFANLMIEKIQQVEDNWQKPWITIAANTRNFFPQNLTGRRYAGGNAFLLLFLCEKFQYQTPVFMTFNQAKEAGISVLKGSKSFPVYYFLFYVYHKETRKKITFEEYKALSREQQQEYNVIPTYKYYSVFNLDQTNFSDVRPEEWEALREKFRGGQAEQPDGTTGEAHPEIDAMLEAKSWFCPIREQQGDRAFYSPLADYIVVPLRSQFVDMQSFYETLLHEMGHSTGHPTRLNRDLAHPFGSEEYGKEELTAEFAAALAGMFFGIAEHIRTENAAYLKSWIKGKYSINSLVYWVTYVHNVVYSFYRSMIYCYINSTQRCAGSIVIDIIPTNGADKRKFFPFAPYFPVTNVIKRYFYPYFPAIIGIKGYSFPYFPYLSGIMKIKTALYSLFSRLDWHKTVVFPCLGEIYEGIRSLSWEIPVT